MRMNDECHTLPAAMSPVHARRGPSREFAPVSAYRGNRRGRIPAVPERVFQSAPSRIGTGNFSVETTDGQGELAPLRAAPLVRALGQRKGSGSLQLLPSREYGLV